MSGTISGSTTLSVSAPALVSIAITPANPSLAAGTNQQLTATGTYSDGSTQNLTNTVVWSSSATGVATVANTGLANAVAVGSATITATSGAISGTTTLTVTQATLVSIAVTPAIPTIALGTKQQFTAIGTYTDSSTQDITATAQWSSDTLSVATISNDSGSQGLATSLATGTAKVTATSGSINGNTTLTVGSAALTSIAVTPANPSLPSGITQQFTATGTYTDGTTQNLTATASWSSDPPAVATINTSGLATTVTAGSANISATSGTISSATLLTVTTATLVSIAITPQNVTVPKGMTQQFTATGTYSDGTTHDLTTVGYWTSSDATVATISDAAGTNGLATTLGAGSTTITVTSGSVSANTTFNVSAAALVSIAIAPQSDSIALGTTQQFTATGTYTDGTTQDLTTIVTWASDTATVAVISNATGSNGLATSAGAGVANISATSGTISSSTTLTVTGAALVSIAVTPGSASLAAGLTQQLTATGTYSDGTTQVLTSVATWTSSAAAVASVSSTGLVTAIAQGSSTITAALGAISGSSSVTVTPAVLTSLSVAPTVITLFSGQQQQFTATGTYSDGSTQNLTTSVTWQSTGKSATVTSGGLATAGPLGSASVTATSSSITASAILISVLATPPTSHPGTLTFPPVPSGTPSSPQSTTIYNMGTGTLSILGVTVSGAGFQLSQGTVPVTLASGAGATFTFSFTPGSTGGASGTATFSFDKSSQLSVVLNGRGTSTGAIAGLNTNTLSFGQQPVGTISPASTVTITNQGTTTLTLQTVTVAGPFYQNGFTNSVQLTSGSSFGMTVFYAPGAVGTSTGTIALTYDVLAPQGISLTGTGTAATALGISTFPTLPSATQGALYQANLTAVGGVGQLTWSLASGSPLPSGLTLSAAGLISGTLSSSVAVGSYSFTAKVSENSSPFASASLALTLPVGAQTGAACNNISWNVTGKTTPLVAITDLGTGYYGAYQGGLYADGSNVDDPTHNADGIAAAEAIEPLDSNGNPSSTGHYVFVTIGHSNTAGVSEQFVSLASPDPSKNPSLVVVDGATGNASADDLQDPSSIYWSVIINDYLPNAGVTANQVEAVWLNDVDVSHPPSISGLQAMLENIARNILIKFPNTKILYLGSVNYTAYSNGVVTDQPEPTAYETGFAAKSAIQDQINGVGNLNYNPGNGPVTAPWMAWGPYYWTNGLLGRSDGVTWSCQDANPDGVHPSASGRLKTAAQLLNFLKTDATATPWFLAP
jgi:uncharacterized protein YjdB